MVEELNLKVIMRATFLISTVSHLSLRIHDEGDHKIKDYAFICMSVDECGGFGYVYETRNNVS